MLINIQTSILDINDSKSTREKIEEIFDLLLSFEPSKRERGKTLLSFLKHTYELHELAEFSKDRNFKIKYYVIEHLAKFENENAIKDLISFLSDESKIIQRIAARSIDNISLEEKYDYLIPLISEGPVLARLYAIRAIGDGRQVNAVLPLLEVLSDENEDIRYQVISSLRLIGDSRSHGDIVRYLGDESPSVRYVASLYCGTCRVKEGASSLFELLKDESPKIRTASVWAIGQIGAMEHIVKLKDIFEKEKDENVRGEILAVLYHSGQYHLLEGMKSGDDSTKAMADWYFTSMNGNKNLKTADICLFVEGSYPYVSGGVSRWVADLLEYFSDLTFSIVYVGASSSEIRQFKYKVPPNVLYYNQINIFDMPKNIVQVRSNIEKKFDLIYDFIADINNKNKKDYENIFAELGVFGNLSIELSDLLSSREGWKFVRKIYSSTFSDLPFLEFIWSYRSMVLPVYNILNARIPPAKLYYSPLTGYSGLAASLASIHYKKPMIITEHGIYHRERKIEINQADWLFQAKDEGFVASEMFSGLKKIWIQMYELFSSVTYKFTDSITTLFKDNAKMEIEAGADGKKIVIIPNGIDIEQFSHINKDKFGEKETFVIGLAGRIVEIKDIKTFIWAARFVCDKLAGKVKFLIMGPYDEDPDYADECMALKSLLDLDDVITFTGNVNLKEYFKEVDILVLTSISEGQPLVIMEAMASGIPVVTSNVGAAKELLFGNREEDKGSCGILTKVHSPHETSESIIEILSNPEMYKKMSHVGRNRINKYYRKKDVLNMYRNEFNKYLTNGE